MKSDFFTAVLIDYNPIYYITRQEEIEKKFTAIKNDLELLLIPIESGTLTKDEFISVIETCNQIIEDMYLFNRHIVCNAIYDDNPKTRAEFIKKYSINTLYHENPDHPDSSIFKINEYENIRHTFKLSGYRDVLRDKLDKAIEVGYKTIYETWGEK